VTSYNSAAVSAQYLMATSNMPTPASGDPISQKSTDSFPFDVNTNCIKANGLPPLLRNNS